MIKTISKISILIVYLALVRCLIEPFRLYYINQNVNFQDLKPFLLGALTAALFTLIMGIAFYNSKFKLVISLSIACVILLLIIKFAPV